MSEALLIHDPRLANVRTVYLVRLHRAGFTSWTKLVEAAQDDPNSIRKVRGNGPLALDQLRAAFTAAKIEHNLTTKR